MFSTHVKPRLHQCSIDVAQHVLGAIVGCRAKRPNIVVQYLLHVRVAETWFAASVVLESKLNVQTLLRSTKC